jgi:K+-transporting ATPase KdpF subunit
LKEWQRERNDRYADRGRNPGLFYIFMGLRAGGQEIIGEKMNWEYAISGLISLILLGYLVYALLWPEHF